jgi:hypothetical protein
VTAYTDAQSTDTYGRRYVFANLRQKVFATEFRADWIITPKLSFQVYAQPYIVSGKYENFKALAAPKTFDFMQFGENGSTLTKILNDDGSIASYILDADGDGPAIARTIGNPDFNYVSLRGNAVLRWEYRPGSALFLVWNQTREEIEPSGDYSYNHSFRSLADTKADNIFMLKASFWF